MQGAKEFEPQLLVKRRRAGSHMPCIRRPALLLTVVLRPGRRPPARRSGRGGKGRIRLEPQMPLGPPRG